MKKILAILLAAMMLLSVVACANNDNNEPETPDVELAYDSAEALMTMIWNAFGDEEKFFVGGGDYEHMVMDAPGKFHLDIEEAAASLNAMTHYPVAAFDKLTDAATVMHGMLQNNFTAAAFCFANAEDASAMAETMKNLYPSVQWACGFPEKFAVITAPGNYVIVVYGLGEYCVDPFVAYATETIDGAVVVANQNLG
ncbi:MAG: hypothetical protein IIX15_04835 [Clostridia bacterium]|nr:hypothetical protein [Clostridia bacterium]